MSIETQQKFVLLHAQQPDGARSIKACRYLAGENVAGQREASRHLQRKPCRISLDIHVVGHSIADRSSGSSKSNSRRSYNNPLRKPTLPTGLRQFFITSGVLA